MILLVIDVQKGIMKKDLFAFEKVKENIQELIQAARNNRREIIFVQHDDGAGTELTQGKEAYELDSFLDVQKGEKVFIKNVNSAFHPSVRLREYLKQKGETQVMICGLQTDYCMDATIKSGFENGFEMIVPALSNSTFDNQLFSAETAYRFYNEIMWPDRYAKCVSAEKALFMLKE